MASVQPLGYLAWAACGKDPSFNPTSILTEARRTVRYSAVELAELDYADRAPDSAALFAAWRQQLADATDLVDALPPDEAGTAVLARDGSLFRGTLEHLQRALANHDLVFHGGSIRGAFPRLAEKGPGL